MPVKERTVLKFDPASLDWIGLRFIVVANRYMASLYAEMAEQHQLQRDDVAILVCLSITSAATAAEIVRYTGRPKNSISRAVIGLEEAGLLSRSSHPDDGRAADLTLTAQGRRLFKQISGHFADHDKRLLAGMTEHERREFTRLLNIASDSSVNWD